MPNDTAKAPPAEPELFDFLTDTKEAEFIARCLEQWAHKVAGNRDDAERARELSARLRREAIGQ